MYRCSQDKFEEVRGLLAAVQSASEAVPGVITFDIGRSRDPVIAASALPIAAALVTADNVFDNTPRLTLLR